MVKKHKEVTYLAGISLAKAKAKPLEKQKVVSRRAVIARVNRRLPEGQQLIAPRGDADMIHDFKKNETFVLLGRGLEAVARELGALKPWETVEPKMR